VPGRQAWSRSDQRVPCESGPARPRAAQAVRNRSRP